MSRNKKKSNKRKLSKAAKKVNRDQTSTTPTTGQVSQTSTSQKGRYIDCFRYSTVYHLNLLYLLIQKRINTRKNPLQKINHPTKKKSSKWIVAEL